MSNPFNKYLLGALLLLLCQCTRNRDSITGPEQQREPGQTEAYFAYSAVLNSFAAGQSQEFVLNDSTVFWNVADSRDYIKSHFPDIADETLDNYLAINKHNIALLNIPDLQVSCHIVSSARSNQWKSLFPKAGSLIHISQAGVNTVKDQAIVYVSEYVAPLAASGYLYFLKKNPAGWSVAKSVVLWIS